MRISFSIDGCACQMCSETNTALLNGAGPVAEQVLLLENIGTSVLVGPEQLPSLHRLLLTAASTLQMEPPDLYIKQVSLTWLNWTLTWHACLSKSSVVNHT